MNKSEFNVTEDVNGLKTLSFNCQIAEDCIKYILKNEIPRVSLLEGYHHKDLATLFPVKNKLKGLFLNENVNCVDINLFKNLQQLYIPKNKSKEINIGTLKLLKVLSLEYAHNVTGIADCSGLETLSLINYKGNLQFLDSLKNIKKLTLTKWGDENIDTVKNPNLSELEINYSSKLENIEGLKYLKNLKTLKIEACKNISSFEVLQKLEKLEKLVIVNSGQIKSLKFLKDLKKLSFFSFFGTNILDGDLSFIKGINYVSFDDKRHYNLKLKDITKQNHI